VTPAHGLGAGGNAGFGARGLCAGVILGFSAVEQRSLAAVGLALLRFLYLSSGGGLVFVVTVKGPDGACAGSRNRTERAKRECEANNQKESLHSEDLI
jgi:hypothetical protein